MDRERREPGSPGAGPRAALVLIDVGVVVMVVLSIVAVVAGAGFGSLVLAGPWCDASPEECRISTQEAGSRRFEVLLAIVLCLATVVLPILFARMTRSLHDAPWSVAGRLLACLAGYLVPVAVILLAIR
jgi:hypothetical protein